MAVIQGKPIDEGVETETKHLRAEVHRLRGVLRILAHHLDSGQSAEQRLRFTQELARAALQSQDSFLRVGDFALDVQLFEEAQAAFSRGEGQSVEDILGELQGRNS